MLDELFERLVGTLRLAVQVYVELRATDNDLNRAMKSLARSHKAVLTDIRPFAPADAFGGPAPLEDELDDWRMLDAVRLVDALESELLEIADELYWSTAPTAVKRALETLIDASSEMLEQLERIEARAHRDHRSPPDGEGDMFDRQFKRGHIRGSEPDNPVDGEDGDYEDGASDDAGPGDGSVDADRSNPGGLGGVFGGGFGSGGDRSGFGGGGFGGGNYGGEDDDHSAREVWQRAGEEAGAGWNWDDVDDGDEPDGRHEEPIEPHDPPVEPAPSGLDAYPVWYATNRGPNDPHDHTRGFGRRRSTTGVHRGRVLVHVPSSHRIGSLGSNVLIRLARWSDDRLRIERIEPLSGRPFWEALNAGVRNGDGRHVVVFIHGYNVSFEGAALRAAQLGFDLGVDGAMTFFSWPSKGRLQGYFADGDSVAASAPDITDFLVAVATQPEVRHVHVIAHSMGNRGALAAISAIAADAERLSGRRFGQFILAAADVDADVFRNGAHAYLSLGERTTLYVSSRDRALKASSLISDYARVGYHPPISILEGIDTIDVGDVDLDALGHGYVGDSRGVLADIHRLINSGAPPEDRFGIARKRDRSGRRYYRMRG